jgi:hypothetical protein
MFTLKGSRLPAADVKNIIFFVRPRLELMDIIAENVLRYLRAYIWLEEVGIYVYFFWQGGLGFELRASCSQSSALVLEPHLQSLLMIFNILNVFSLQTPTLASALTGSLLENWDRHGRTLERGWKLVKVL